MGQRRIIFLIFSILRILPLRFRTAENISNLRRNTDKYRRLATLPFSTNTHTSFSLLLHVLATVAYTSCDCCVVWGSCWLEDW